MNDYGVDSLAIVFLRLDKIVELRAFLWPRLLLAENCDMNILLVVVIITD